MQKLCGVNIIIHKSKVEILELLYPSNLCSSNIIWKNHIYTHKKIHDHVILIYATLKLNKNIFPFHYRYRGLPWKSKLKTTAKTAKSALKSCRHFFQGFCPSIHFNRQRQSLLNHTQLNNILKIKSNKK